MFLDRPMNVYGSPLSAHLMISNFDSTIQYTLSVAMTSAIVVIIIKICTCLNACSHPHTPVSVWKSEACYTKGLHNLLYKLYRTWIKGVSFYVRKSESWMSKSRGLPVILAVPIEMTIPIFRLYKQMLYRCNKWIVNIQVNVKQM